MRLIDAEKAIENTRNEVYWTESEQASVRNFLNHQPTIDPESLRPRGRWELDKRTGYIRCSECRDVYIEREWIADGKWSFCPNCGAKMED